MEPVQVHEITAQSIIALAGNPNSGKTTIFNNLTGARQQVGNWPGVTVEKKEGKLIHQGTGYYVIDLPGTYSLGASSEDEMIAREFILNQNPDVIINTVSASNLERNLYLTIQLLETGANVVVALNMIDEARARGINIDIQRLSERLRVPVIPTTASKNEGIRELSARTIQSIETVEKNNPVRITYGSDVDDELRKLELLIKEHDALSQEFPARWLAIKLLEEDEEIHRKIKEYENTGDILEQCSKSIQYLKETTGEDTEFLIAGRRYNYIKELLNDLITREDAGEQSLSLSDKIDKVVTNKVLGVPVFLLAMWAVFQFTFTLAAPMIGWIEAFFGWLGGLAGAGLSYLNAPEILTSFIVNGVIDGVGAVLVFIPNIFLLFFAISILEDSGYMARAAYIMDRFMNLLGLQGKAFIPLVIGFGCNVPAIMATRTLENKQDRLVTILITPFMSCGARLPVYVLFVGAFFTANQGLVIFSLYLLGILMAIIMGRIFKTFLFPGETSPLIIELPPYRVPTLKSVFIHMWERGSEFIKKAGSIIFAAVIIIWFLSVFPMSAEYAGPGSIIGKLGSLVAPVLAPCGFDKWEAGVALFFGILAKEVIIGTLGVIYSAGEGGLTASIQQFWTPLSAYAFMVMTLLYTPCAAVVGIIKRETNSWKWPAFAMGYTMLLGWLVAVIVYQLGKLIGFG